MALTCFTSSCCLESPLWEKMGFLVSSLQHMLEGCWPWQGNLHLQRAWCEKEL